MKKIRIAKCILKVNSTKNDATEPGVVSEGLHLADDVIVHVADVALAAERQEMLVHVTLKLPHGVAQRGRQRHVVSEHGQNEIKDGKNVILL